MFRTKSLLVDLFNNLIQEQRWLVLHFPVIWTDHVASAASAAKFNKRESCVPLDAMFLTIKS